MPSELEILAGLAADPSKTIAFDEQIDFTDTIAASGTATASVRIQTAGRFEIDAIMGRIWIAAASGAAIAGTPIPSESSVTLAGNTFPTLAHFGIEIWTNGVPWFRGVKRADLLIGTAAAPYYPLTKRVIPGGATISAKIYNYSTIGVLAQLSLPGRNVL